MSHTYPAHIHAPGPDCPRFAALLPVLDDDTVDPDNAAHARAHLATCAYCQTQRAAYDRVDTGLRRHFGLAVAKPYSTEEIMSTILDDSDGDSDTVTTHDTRPPSQTMPARPRRRRMLSGLAALAAVLVLSLLATALFISHPRVPATTTQQTFAVPAGASLFMTGVSMVSSDEGWAIAHYTPPTNGDGTPTGNAKPTAVLFHFHNGAWTRVNMPVSASEQPTLNAISMDSPTDGWAVGSIVANGQLGALLLHYDGHAWRQVSNPIQAGLGAVRMLSPTDGWALSGFGNAAAIYHYDGASWTPRPLPAVSVAGQRDTLQLYRLSIISPDDAWAAGAALPPTNAGGSANASTASPAGVILHYTGGSWRIQQIIPGAMLTGIAMDAPADGWAVGADVSQQSQQSTPTDGSSPNTSSPSQPMLLFHYTAGRWVNVPLSNIDPQRLTGGIAAVIMSSPTDGWIMTNANGATTSLDQPNNTFVLLHYDGATWTEVATPSVKSRNAYTIYSFSLPAPNDLWAVGSALSIPDHYAVGPQGSSPISTSTPLILRYHDGAWTVYTS